MTVSLALAQPTLVYLMSGRNAFRAGIHSLANPYRNRQERELWDKGHRLERRLCDSGGAMTITSPSRADIAAYAAAHPRHSQLGPTHLHPRRQTVKQQPEWRWNRENPPTTPPPLPIDVRLRVPAPRQQPAATVTHKSPKPHRRRVVAPPVASGGIDFERLKRFNHKHRTAV